MGCIWSSKPSSRCLVCNRKPFKDERFLSNKCGSCTLVARSRESPKILFNEYTYHAVRNRPSTTIQHLGNVSTIKRTPVPNLNRHNVCGELPQPRPSTTRIEPQFGEYHCRPCRHHWQSLRSWSTKYQKCKRCKKPVYPHKLRELLDSDYTSTKEDPKEHDRQLCEMCNQLGYPCKNYVRQINRK